MSTETVIAHTIEKISKWEILYFMVVSPLMVLAGIFLFVPNLFWQADLLRLILLSMGLSFLIISSLIPVTFLLTVAIKSLLGMTGFMVGILAVAQLLTISVIIGLTLLVCACGVCAYILPYKIWAGIHLSVCLLPVFPAYKLYRLKTTPLKKE